MEHSDFLPFVPTASFASTVSTLVGSFFALDGHGASVREPGVWSAAPQPLVFDGDGRISQVPGESVCQRAALYDPGGPA
jgi:hypothetical protein